MRKRTVCISLLCLALVFSSVYAVFRLERRAQSWRQRAAEMNFSYWNGLGAMTAELEKMEPNEKNLKENLLYINGVVNACTSNIRPMISESGESSNNSFLSREYYSLAADIVSESSRFPQSKRQQAAELFREMTSELGALCSEICNIEYENRAELMNEKSDVYRETQKKINSFCDKYKEKIHMLEVLYG